MTVDIEKGIDLWMRIAAPRALLENEEWWRWPTQPPRSLAWSNGLRCVSCKKAILVLRDLRLLITLLHLTGEFRPLTFQLVNRTVPLGADKENLLATKWWEWRCERKRSSPRLQAQIKASTITFVLHRVEYVFTGLRSSSVQTCQPPKQTWSMSSRRWGGRYGAWLDTGEPVCIHTCKVTPWSFCTLLFASKSHCFSLPRVGSCAPCMTNHLVCEPREWAGP